MKFQAKKMKNKLCLADNIFFELIRVAIGNAVCLSHTPTATEWNELYAMAKKQSLVGICFAGVQRLQGQQQCPPEQLYLQWMGMAAKIQQRNETLNRQCAELQAKLSDCGMRSSILKGQGMASLYSEPLRALRQSGDIDVWVDGSIDSTIGTLKSAGIEVKNVNIKHAEAEVFEGTEVEIHFVPTWFYNPVTQGKLAQWIEKSKEAQMTNLQNGLVVPTIEFNLVYSLIHLFRHTLDEGVGLRQLMDYYFVLKTLSISPLKGEYLIQVKNVISDLGLNRFASALMCVLGHVFGLERECMLWEPNEKDGRLLLDEVMTGGNFGRHNEEQNDRKGKMGYSVWALFFRNLRLSRFDRGDWFWGPVWRISHKLTKMQ